MPVNGPGGPNTPKPTGVGSTARTEEEKPVVTPTPLPDLPNLGWRPRSTGEYAAGGDGFAGGRTLATSSTPSTSPAVQAKVQAAIDRYQTRIEVILQHDALSLAQGKTPFRPGETLTETQQKELQSAATDFLQDMPLGALSPAAASRAQAILGERGQRFDMQTTTLRDVGKVAGDVAGDIAKDLAKQLKGASPAAYYGLAGGAAAAVGAVAYFKGSAALEKVGIKPELKTGFFNKHVELKAQASFEERFSNFKLNGELGVNANLGNHTAVSGRVAFDLKGINSLQGDLRYTQPNFNLSATARYEVPTETLTAGVSANYRPRQNLNLSANATHNFQDHRTTAGLTATYSPKRDVDFALSATHDSRGESRVGVGVAIRF